jgi:hypothetical protein
MPQLSFIALDRWEVKDIISTDYDDDDSAYQSGGWLSGLEPPIYSEWKDLSFKAVLCSLHQVMFSSVSQKLLLNSHMLAEPDIQAFQSKTTSSHDSDEDSDPTKNLDVSMRGMHETSRFRIHFLTNAHRSDPFDGDIASVLSLTCRRPGICVVGPPACGTTTLAKTLALEMGLGYFSIPDAIEAVMKTSPMATEETTTLADPFAHLHHKIRNAILSGQVVTRSDGIRCVLASLRYNSASSLHGTYTDPYLVVLVVYISICYTNVRCCIECQGYVLDGIFPHEVLELRDSHFDVR